MNSITQNDEASRERFLWWYEEPTPTNTVDFVKRCVEYFGYKPKTIQTDNGYIIKRTENKSLQNKTKNART